MAAASEVRKPKPAAGEPGNPLPLGDDDEPPAKTRPTAAPRKAPTASKNEKGDQPAKASKKRRNEEWDEDETRTKPAINPFILVGGLGILAVGVLAIGLFVLMRSADEKAEEIAVAEKREADRREREEVLQREREAVQKKNQTKPEPVQPEPVKPDPVEGPIPGPGPIPVPVPGVLPMKPNPDVPAEPVKPKPRPSIIRPAVNPAKITPTKAADKTELTLPGTVDMTCFGGNGRYVLMRIPSEQQVAVLDVCEGKIAKYIPIPEDGALIAASNEHLFVLAPTDNVIQRWNLTTFTKERTAANPLDGPVRGLLIGHATDGPLFVVGPNKFLEPKNLKEIAFDVGNARGLGGIAGPPQSPPMVRISADGRVLAWHTRGPSPSGLSSMVLGAHDAKSHFDPTTVGAILLDPDGVLFTAGGLFTPELKPIGEKVRYQSWYFPPIPAAHGKMYISIAPEDNTTLAGRRGPQKVQLKMLGENKPLLNLNDLAGLDVPPGFNPATVKGLPLHDRVFLVPDAKAVAILHDSANKVTIHKLDVEAALDKAGIDFLFVTSKPGGAVCGEVFTYKLEVKSRKGGVKVKLDAGPEGMKVATDGTVTWAVPANFEGTSVPVILTISDSSGREVLHAFSLPVASRP